LRAWTRRWAYGLASTASAASCLPADPELAFSAPRTAADGADVAWWLAYRWIAGSGFGGPAWRGGDKDHRWDVEDNALTATEPDIDWSAMCRASLAALREARGAGGPPPRRAAVAGGLRRSEAETRAAEQEEMNARARR